MKSGLVLITTGVFGLALGVLAVHPLLRQANSGPTVAHALWASRAVTIAEEAAEADLIVTCTCRGDIPCEGSGTPVTEGTACAWTSHC